MELLTYLAIPVLICLNIYSLIKYKKADIKRKSQALDILAREARLTEKNKKVDDLEAKTASLEAALKAAKEKPTADAKQLLKNLLNGSALVQVTVIDQEYLMFHSPKGLI